MSPAVKSAHTSVVSAGAHGPGLLADSRNLTVAALAVEKVVCASALSASGDCVESRNGRVGVWVWFTVSALILGAEGSSILSGGGESGN